MWQNISGGQYGFRSPEDVAVDSQGFVYVADTGNNRIQKFTNNGTFVTAWGITGNNTGMFNRPAGVAIDSKDFVYVS